MRDLSNLLTVAHLSWAIWANCLHSLIWFERMSEFPTLVIRRWNRSELIWKSKLLLLATHTWHSIWFWSVFNETFPLLVRFTKSIFFAKKLNRTVPTRLKKQRQTYGCFTSVTLPFYFHSHFKLKFQMCFTLGNTFCWLNCKMKTSTLEILVLVNEPDPEYDPAN